MASVRRLICGTNDRGLSPGWHDGRACGAGHRHFRNTLFHRTLQNPPHACLLCFSLSRILFAFVSVRLSLLGIGHETSADSGPAVSFILAVPSQNFLTCAVTSRRCSFLPIQERSARASLSSRSLGADNDGRLLAAGDLRCVAGRARLP